MVEASHGVGVFATHVSCGFLAVSLAGLRARARRPGSGKEPSFKDALLGRGRQSWRDRNDWRLAVGDLRTGAHGRAAHRQPAAFELAHLDPW